MLRLAALAAALAAAQAAAAPAAAQQATERCYGVARAGENEGIDDAEAAGAATLDWQGNAWILTEPGTCLTIEPPPQPDGTPRRGSVQPLARDRP